MNVPLIDADALAAEHARIWLERIEELPPWLQDEYRENAEALLVWLREGLTPSRLKAAANALGADITARQARLVLHALFREAS